jgi:hypothetical protein
MGTENVAHWRLEEREGGHGLQEIESAVLFAGGKQESDDLAETEVPIARSVESWKKDFAEGIAPMFDIDGEIGLTMCKPLWQPAFFHIHWPNCTMIRSRETHE